MESANFVSSLFAPNRYSAKKTVKPVNFVCRAPGARVVCLEGDFNSWDPTSHQMQKQPDGAWFLQMQLNNGHHRYRFRVDGQPALDPTAQGVTRDSQGEKASLIAVS